MSKDQQLKFHFQNPNSPEVTAEYIYRVFLEANIRKFNKLLKHFYEIQQETKHVDFDNSNNILTKYKVSNKEINNW